MSLCHIYKSAVLLLKTWNVLLNSKHLTSTDSKKDGSFIVLNNYKNNIQK